MSGLSRDLQAHDAPLTLKTLGGAAVFPASQVETQPPLLGPGKPLALYAYLACVGGRVSREQLADLLWSDLEPESARHALRQAIWTLKKRLGEDAIAADATDVRIGAPAHSDRQAFLEAVTRQDLATALDDGPAGGHCQAALAASIFHFGETTVANVKRELIGRGIPVRTPGAGVA